MSHFKTGVLANGTVHVTVIGAGAIGTTVAYELVKAGYAVRLVDRLPPGEGCSHGNAGVFAAASAQPLAYPGTVMQVPKYLADPKGPLHVRLRYLPRLLPWLAQFGWHGLFGNKGATTEAMHMLVASSVEDYERLAREIGEPNLVRRNGWIYAYNNTAEMRANLAKLEEDRRRGFDYETLNSRALRERLPGISAHYVGAHHVHGIGHTPNPGRLVKAIANRIQHLGGEIFEAGVEGMRVEDRRVSALRTTLGELSVDQLVIAAGAYSARLMAMLGESVPLETERGYHAMFLGESVVADIPVMDAGLKAIVTPMEAGVRAAGTVEFASLDAPENPQRARNLADLAKRMYPGLSGSNCETWLGRRPTLPDSLPVIDRARSVSNVVLGFGHQHVGLTGAPETARLIARLVKGEPPNINMAPYTITRF